MVDAPMDGKWLLELLGGTFQLLTIDAEAPESLEVDGITVSRVALSAEGNPVLAERYLGGARKAVYLMRPDQHVAARWDDFDEAAVRAAVMTATGRA
jgi:3-(3-hydroxy-phenyl)propionate hydroxylase